MQNTATLKDVESALLMVPTKVVTGWDEVPARDLKVFSEEGKQFIVIFPEEWADHANNALIIDPITGSVAAVNSDIDLNLNNEATNG